MIANRFVEMMDTVLRFAVYTQQQRQLVGIEAAEKIHWSEESQKEFVV